jgi:hypothetical protein
LFIGVFGGCPNGTIYPYFFVKRFETSEISETQHGRNTISTCILDSLLKIRDPGYRVFLSGEKKRRPSEHFRAGRPPTISEVLWIEHAKENAHTPVIPSPQLAIQRTEGTFQAFIVKNRCRDNIMHFTSPLVRGKAECERGASGVCLVSTKEMDQFRLDTVHRRTGWNPASESVPRQI